MNSKHTKKMIQLRDYQLEIANKGVCTLRELKILYLAMSVRTGKTLTSLNVAEQFGAKKVLFITKKLAISTIKNDYNLLKPNFEIEVINNESLHKVVNNDFDLIISDENHRNSSYPKPNKSAKTIKENYGHLPMIFLSGTPAIESASQYFHSFWISNYSPFRNYRNFYQWANQFVNKKTKYLGSIQIPDYSDAKLELIMPIIEPYMVFFTQKDAGFESEITENVLYCEMTQRTENMLDTLMKSRIIQGNTEVILADTAAKLMSKIHQIANGTVIFESGNSAILDNTKAVFIKNHFKGNKIAIFYFFQKELELLKTVFGEILTTDLDEFNSTDKCFAIQQTKGSEAISLKAALFIVYYSWGYSGKNYCQGRDRMTTIDRKENNVFFVMQQKGINRRIYEAIKNKKNYNEKQFKKDYKIRE